jgi:hypothetical protein
MAMNFAPLDCPCQGASSESKKIYLDFFILEKIAKNQKIHIFGSYMQSEDVQWVHNLKLCLLAIGGTFTLCPCNFIN